MYVIEHKFWNEFPNIPHDVISYPRGARTFENYCRKFGKTIERIDYDSEYDDSNINYLSAMIDFQVATETGNYNV